MNDRAGLLAEPAEVRAILLAAAKAGESITYSEVLGLLGHDFTRPKMRALCKVLAFIDDEAEERGVGMIFLGYVQARTADEAKTVAREHMGRYRGRLIVRLKADEDEVARREAEEEWS